MSGTEEAYIYTTNEAINAVWIIVSTCMIFLMQLGFSFVECGSVREKNYKSILIKNTFITVIGIIAWWLIGYGIGFGMDQNSFMGTKSGFFSSVGFTVSIKDMYLHFLFELSFAITSASIVSGAIAERSQVS